MHRNEVAAMKQRFAAVSLSGERFDSIIAVDD